MATLKRIEKRMNDVETWVKDFEQGQGPAQTMENLNWLVGQTRQLGERLSQVEQQAMQMQEALQKNAEIVNAFVEEQEIVPEWQAYLETLQKAAEEENALQESETESLDVQEQAEDGEEVGEGDA